MSRQVTFIPSGLYPYRRAPKVSSRTSDCHRTCMTNPPDHDPVTCTGRPPTDNPCAQGEHCTHLTYVGPILATEPCGSDRCTEPHIVERCCWCGTLFRGGFAFIDEHGPHA